MADKNLAALTAASALAAADLFYTTQSGNSRKATGTQLAALITLLNSSPVLIQRVITAASQTSVSFTSIPGTYTHLRIIGCGRSATGAASDNVRIQFNSDTTNGNYGTQQLQGTGATASSASNPGSINNLFADLSAASATANQSGTFESLIPMYASTTFIKAWQTVTAIPGFPLLAIQAGRWNVTTAVTTITLVLNSGAAFVDGSVFDLIGIP